MFPLAETLNQAQHEKQQRNKKLLSRFMFITLSASSIYNKTAETVLSLNPFYKDAAWFSISEQWP